MKKNLIFILTLICVLVLTGCKNNRGLAFKEDYESMNGKTNASGKVHRTVSIDSNNPFEQITPEELLNKLQSKETFYVYFGDKLCPWCRSVIEKAIEVANNKNIEKIYYVAIWDDEGKEIVRDKYELQDGKIIKTIEGCKEYSKLLEYFDNVLSDYNLTDTNENKVSTGEKRIYAPNFIYVENGTSIRLTTGISEKQNDSRETLTNEILEDEEELFDEFFK